MRLIILAFLVLLTSCGTVHKVITSSKKTVDSVATSTRDTSHISHETASSDNFSAKDIHIRVDYPTYKPGDTGLVMTGDAVPWEPYYPDKDSVKASDYTPVRKKVQTYADLIRQAIASSGGAGRIPSSITIDIGSIQDTSSRSEKKVTDAGHATSTAAVHKTEEATKKEVSRWSLPIWAWGLIILAILALIYKYWAKIIAFKTKIFPL